MDESEERADRLRVLDDECRSINTGMDQLSRRYRVLLDRWGVLDDEREAIKGRMPDGQEKLERLAQERREADERNARRVDGPAGAHLPRDAADRGTARPTDPGV